MKTMQQNIIENILAHIKKHFYSNNQSKCFYQDKHMLIYAITWPATWFEQRALRPSQSKYQQLIENILEQITLHGKPHLYQKYFPRYLLKCIQQWFYFKGQPLYEQLKHIRNHLCSFEQILTHIQSIKHSKTTMPHSIEVMANTHRLINSQKQRNQTNSNHKQLQLF